jgi:site-specific recombinase XerD
MGAPEVEGFLTHLAIKENIAASTQNQALSALLFLYREVLHQDLGPVDALRAKRPKRLPTVLTTDETLRLISCLSGTHQLMAKLIYGSGELNPDDNCPLGTCADSHAPRRAGSEQSSNGCAFSARTG